MQRFIAELSSMIDKDAFDRCWQSDCVANPNYSVEFGFDGRRVSISVESTQARVSPQDQYESLYTWIMHTTGVRSAGLARLMSRGIE